MSWLRRRSRWNASAATAALVVLTFAATAPSAEKSAGPPTPQSIAFWDTSRGLAVFSERCAPAVCYRVRVTADGGRSWRIGPRVRSTCVAVAPGTSDAWLSDGDCYPGPKRPPRLLHSHDGGLTWQRIGHAPLYMTFPTRKVGFGAAVDLRNNAWSLVRTRDGGRTWRRIASPCGKTAQYEVPSFTTARAGWVLCAGQPGAGSQLKAVYRTGDGGRHWEIVMSTGWSSSGGATPKAIPTQGYADGIAFAKSRGWVYQSRWLSYTSADAGRTWRPTAFGLRNPTDIGIEGLAALSNRDAIALVRSADWKRRILVRTADGGRTWHAVRTWRG